jgi:hypothetical protein
MAYDLAHGLQAWASSRRDVVVYDLSASGCPISRGGTRRLPDGSAFPIDPKCAWWSDPSSDRSVNLAQFHPDIVVMQDGINELPDRKLPQWSDYRHTGEPLFDQWLLNEYTAAMKTFRSQGAKLLALNAVCANWQILGSETAGAWSGYAQNGDGDQRVSSLDTTTQVLAGDGAQIGDLDSNVCPGGKFSMTVDGISNARPDGYHLTPTAATAVANQWLGPLILKTAALVP